MTPPHPLTRATSAPTAGERFRAGGWYFVLTILSGGIFAAVPFWHAASRLGRREVRTLALMYTAAGIYLAILFALTPPQQADGTSSNEAQHHQRAERLPHRRGRVPPVAVAAPCGVRR